MLSRILIVDDLSTNLRIFAQYAARMGPDIAAHCLSEPAAALRWLKAQRADLLIVDYHMPGMTGAEFVRQARQITGLRDLPALLIGSPRDRRCTMTAWGDVATEFLPSPVSQVEFRQRARAMIDGRRNKSVLARRLERAADIRQAKSLTALAAKADPIEARVPPLSQSSGQTLVEQIIDSVPVMVSAVDQSGRCLFVNAYLAALYGKQPEAMAGKPLPLIHPGTGEADEARRNAVVLASGNPIADYEERYCLPDGEIIVQCSKAPLRDAQGRITGVLTTGVDITARKTADQHRAHFALHDQLTGLPNRALLNRELRETLDGCYRDGQEAALMLVDLDRFKTINDTRGHQVGDLLLQEVADRIRRTLTRGDMAARIGGDEFAIVLRNVNGRDDAAARASELIAAINQPYRLAGVKLTGSASVGITMAPADGDCADDLLRMADLAMYEAKARGRNNHRFYSPRMNQIAQLNARLEQQLREAIPNGELFLEYQPIVRTADNAISGFEALLRWNHPDLGPLSPGDFLHIAEETGLIEQIGKWVMAEACAQIVESGAHGIDIPRIAINVSPRHIASPDFSADLLDCISAFRIPAKKLSIEITENLFLDHDRQVKETLDVLRSHGVGIAIDDFGTGYSSFQYMRNLPADRLKIDKSFINQLASSESDRAIVGAIVHLAHALGMSVVAEGVEDETQARLLTAAGCDELQGYHFAMPVGSAHLERALHPAPYHGKSATPVTERDLARAG